jgi:transcriptional regulator with XRE-family HTH domain
MTTKSARIALQKSSGQAFKARREELGISQEAFAEKIGMHRTYYSAIERGEKNVTIDTMLRVCSALSVPISDVLKEAA